MNNTGKLIFLIVSILQCPVIATSGTDYNNSIQKLHSITLDSAYNSTIVVLLKNYTDDDMADSAIFLLQSQMLIRKNEPVKYQNLFLLLCKLYYQQKNYPKSLHLLDSALKTGTSLLPGIQAKLYRIKGQNFYKMQEFAKSLEAYRQSLSMLKKNNDKTQMDDVLAAIASMYFEMDNLPEALRYAIEAEKISVETNDLDSRSRILNTIGNINKTLGNYDEAKKNYEDAFAVAEKTSDQEGMILTTSSIAMIEMRRKNFKEALNLQQKALRYAEELKSKHYIGGMYMNLARIKWDEENLEEAKKYYLLAVAIAVQIGDRQNAALGNANLGFLHSEEKEYKKSNEFLKEALSLASETGDLALLREIYGGFYDNYKALDDSKQALYYHELYKNYTDSVLNEDKARELANLKTKFAVNEKEKELQLKSEKQKAVADAELRRQKLFKNFSIAGALLLLLFTGFVFQRYRERHRTSLLLAEQNRTIEKAYRDLKDAQDELVETEKQREAQSIRVRIARDIHDEIGSGLTKITMLSDILRKKVPQEELADSLSKITSYSKSVSSSLSEIVWAVNPGHDNAASLIGYMKLTAAGLLEDSGVRYTLEFPEKEIQNEIHPEVKRNIYLVMKEAINNSLKYAKAQNISVSFYIEDNKFRLTVEDDGNGFDARPFAGKELFGGNGQGDGNGLWNMKYRMHQHNNTFQIISSPGNGCKIIAEGALS